MSTHHSGVVSTSTAVTTTARSDGYFGTPFIVRHQYDATVFNPVTVATGSAPVTVTVASFTTSLPES